MSEFGYEPAQSFRIVGKAVTYFVSGKREGSPEPGEGMELVPSVPLAKLCDTVEVTLLKDGQPVPNAEVVVSYPDGSETLLTNSEGTVKVRVRTKLVVLKAVIVEDGVRQVSTLSVVGV